MIKVGCCGFPTKREIYYQAFQVVEVQQTFYQLRLVATGKRWRKEAPPGFEFTVKAWQPITHEPSSPTYRGLRMKIPEEKKKDYGFFKGTLEIEEAWSKTADFARALEAKKILFQSPASFLPSSDHIQDMKHFFGKIKALPFVYIWEPRGQWKRDEVERVCRELEIIPCLDPFGGDSIRGDLLYLRLHGKTDYRYTYSEAEMKELIRLGEHYLEAYMVFNNINMYEDARRLKVLSESVA
jgi:uncharacterized protein YecE (DUF72 family)